MPKRALPVEPGAEESDLSSVAEAVLNDDQAVAGAKEHSEPEPTRKRRKAVATKQEASDDKVEPSPVTAAKSKTRRRTGGVETKVKKEGDGEDEEDEEAALTPPKRKTRKPEKGVKDELSEGEDKAEVGEKAVKRKRKSKADKEAELVDMALSARTVGHKLYIGAHVSSAGGVHQSVLNSVHIGANAFALFLKSNQRWQNPPLKEEDARVFHARCSKHEYDQARHVVPHGSYLVNLAHTDGARIEQAYGALLDDLKRCETLGIKLYNIHPGNDQCGDRQKAIKQLADNLNKAHAETSGVVILLENMAKGGNVIGSTFEDLRDTIALVDQKDRVGVCIDTCHTFAGGYDIRTPAAYAETMARFDEIVGFKFLRALHLNDSKAPFASYKDLHANIGTGFLGLRAFHNVVNDSRLVGLPLVLETPIDLRDEEGQYVKDEKGKQKEDKSIWAREIKLLESLVGMETESEEFLALEKQFARIGARERKRLSEQVERTQERKEKKGKSAAKNRKNQAKAQQGEESSLSELSEDE